MSARQCLKQKRYRRIMESIETGKSEVKKILTYLTIENTNKKCPKVYVVSGIIEQEDMTFIYTHT